MASMEDDAIAVTIMTEFRVHPGKAAAFAALLQEVIPILEHYGARTRVLRTVFGGPTSQVVTLFSEIDDMASHGRYMASLGADPAFQAWGSKLFGADAPATLLSNSVAQDLAL